MLPLLWESRCGEVEGGSRRTRVRGKEDPLPRRAQRARRVENGIFNLWKSAKSADDSTLFSQKSFSRRGAMARDKEAAHWGPFALPGSILIRGLSGDGTIGIVSIHSSMNLSPVHSHRRFTRSLNIEIPSCAQSLLRLHRRKRHCNLWRVCQKHE